MRLTFFVESTSLANSRPDKTKMFMLSQYSIVIKNLLTVIWPPTEPYRTRLQAQPLNTVQALKTLSLALVAD